MGGDEPQALQEVAEGSCHLPWLLQEHQTTGRGDLERERERETCVYHSVSFL